MMDTERLPCFSHGGYDEQFDRVFIKFSDGTVYEYPDFTLEEWIEWKEAYPRGSYFNFTYRHSPIKYQKLQVFPDNLSYTF